MEIVMTDEAVDAANALGAAIHARDANAIRAIYADDIVVWHGSTGQAQTKAENSGLLVGVFQITSSLEYVNVKRHSIDGGIVQQHTLVGKFDDGRAMPELNACLVIKVNDGLITSIDEYFDGSIYAEVWERLRALTVGSDV
jgi:ketosteroid isomerase-like protein